MTLIFSRSLCDELHIYEMSTFFEDSPVAYTKLALLDELWFPSLDGGQNWIFKSLGHMLYKILNI